MSAAPIALYIHWPFCRKKCPYCDFNSHVPEQTPEAARWLEAYCREFDTLANRVGERRIHSIFFGGGTPSLMPPEIVAGVLQHVQTRWPLEPECEITLEANPTSAEAGKFRAFREAGVNRLSVGVQSLRAEALHFLGREHTTEEAMEALRMARDIFPRYTFDLIYARPGQTVPEWEQELSEALALASGHLSLYQLTIEKGTPFYRAYQDGAFTLPDEDTAAMLYTHTEQMLAEAGMVPYEISNYAAPGQESRHNLVYWRYGEY
ncbi:MAG: radical SAM family heme chaperone HemW, partial [Rickettsiales bacterium]|nr:radical SAM family heme chaperone HemW [Rickettsiales bacterium]